MKLPLVLSFKKFLPQQKIRACCAAPVPSITAEQYPLQSLVQKNAVGFSPRTFEGCGHQLPCVQHCQKTRSEALHHEHFQKHNLPAMIQPSRTVKNN